MDDVHDISVGTAQGEGTDRLLCGRVVNGDSSIFWESLREPLDITLAPGYGVQDHRLLLAILGDPVHEHIGLGFAPAPSHATAAAGTPVSY